MIILDNSKILFEVGLPTNNPIWYIGKTVSKSYFRIITPVMMLDISLNQRRERK